MRNLILKSMVFVLVASTAMAGLGNLAVAFQKVLDAVGGLAKSEHFMKFKPNKTEKSFTIAKMLGSEKVEPAVVELKIQGRLSRSGGGTEDVTGIGPINDASLNLTFFKTEGQGNSALNSQVKSALEALLKESKVKVDIQETRVALETSENFGLASGTRVDGLNISLDGLDEAQIGTLMKNIGEVVKKYEALGSEGLTAAKGGAAEVRYQW